MFRHVPDRDQEHIGSNGTIHNFSKTDLVHRQTGSKKKCSTLYRGVQAQGKDRPLSKTCLHGESFGRLPQESIQATSPIRVF